MLFKKQTSTTSSRRTRNSAPAPSNLLENLESRLLLSTTYSITSVTSLPGGVNGGARPNSLITDSNGNIFGTTQEGGPGNYGTVFEIPAGTTNVLTLATFDGTTGNLPMGNIVIDASGDLFGASSGGGANNRGTLWELKATTSNGTLSYANSISTVWTFSSISGGAYPDYGLVSDGAGNLWGTTFGNSDNLATVFKFTPATDSVAATLQTVATFPKDTHLGSLAVGTNGILAVNNGNIFGNVYNSGNNNGGYLFQLHTAQDASFGALTTLAKFNVNGSSGSLPVGTLFYLPTGGGTSKLVGITTSGGSNGGGTIFSTIISNNVLTIKTLQSFTGTNNIGAHPLGTLLIAGANGAYTLTGVDFNGAANGTGSVFQSSINLTNLASPTATQPLQLSGKSTAFSSATGTHPTGGITMTANGTIFLTTAQDGPLKNGTVIQLSPNASAPANHLAFSKQPPTTSAGKSLGGISIKATGSVLTGNITFSIGTGPSGSFNVGNTTLSTITVAVVNGTATLPASAVLDKAGVYTLRAIDDHGDQVQSANFTISAAPAAGLVLVQSPTTGVVGKSLSPIIIDVVDAFGNIVTSDNSTIILTAKSPAGAKISSNTVSVHKGIATFKNTSLATAGSVVLHAADVKLALDLPAITIGAAPVALAFNSLPTPATVGKSFSIQVRLVDSSGHTVTNDNSPVTISLASQSKSAKLFGTLTVNAVAGIATFSDLTLFTAGQFTFHATSLKLATITSGTLTVLAANANV